MKIHDPDNEDCPCPKCVTEMKLYWLAHDLYERMIRHLVPHRLDEASQKLIKKAYHLGRESMRREGIESSRAEGIREGLEMALAAGLNPQYAAWNREEHRRFWHGVDAKEQAIRRKLEELK